jgi:hypothetical protein
MEHINLQSGNDVAAFRETQIAPDAKTEGELLTISADGKGVPIRHSKEGAEHFSDLSSPSNRLKNGILP